MQRYPVNSHLRRDWTVGHQPVAKDVEPTRCTGLKNTSRTLGTVAATQMGRMIHVGRAAPATALLVVL